LSACEKERSREGELGGGRWLLNALGRGGGKEGGRGGGSRERMPHGVGTGAGRGLDWCNTPGGTVAATIHLQ
jgi:hypothetical protein